MSLSRILSSAPPITITAPAPPTPVSGRIFLEPLRDDMSVECIGRSEPDREVTSEIQHERVVIARVDRAIDAGFDEQGDAVGLDDLIRRLPLVGELKRHAGALAPDPKARVRVEPVRRM